MDNEPDSKSAIRILPTAAEHVEEMEALHCCTYDITPEECDDCLTAAMFRQHLRVFPEGQFVALDTTTNRIVGLTVSMRMDFDPSRPFVEPWVVTTGGGWLTTHVPDGAWMYGVETGVHPEYQGQGVGGRLMEARCEVARRLNLRGIVAGSAIISYGRVADSVPVGEYVADVVAGRRFDTNLSKQLKKGFKVHNIIPNYLEDDDEFSAGWGVTIVWENAAYRESPVPVGEALVASHLVTHLIQDLHR